MTERADRGLHSEPEWQRAPGRANPEIRAADTCASLAALARAPERATPALLLELQRSSGNRAVVALVGATRPLIQREVTKIRRPDWLPNVRATVKIRSGEHRRHVVMSNRMRQAIFAYHTKVDDSTLARLATTRRTALQAFVGTTGTLRTEMAAGAERVHNSMGNLFAGPGGENSAIGFSVQPLYDIAAHIRAGQETMASAELVQLAQKELATWASRGIFGFAKQWKDELAKFILDWAGKLDPSSDKPGEIAEMIESFGDSCSFDVPYEKQETATGRDDTFPPHIDSSDQTKLIAVATQLNDVIANPQQTSIDLYGDSCFGYLKQVENKYV